MVAAVIQFNTPSVGVISSGTVYNLANNCPDDVTIVWNAADASAKTMTLPSPALMVVPNRIFIKDKYGNAGTYNITLSVSNSGTIEGAPSFVMNLNNQCVVLENDGAGNYIVIANYISSGSSPIFNNINYTGHFYYSSNSIAATGTNQATAAVITKDTALVTPTGPGQGVQLPAALGGNNIIITNGSPTYSINVYPVNGGNDAINALAVNAPFIVPPLYEVLLESYTSTYWGAGLSSITPSTAYNTNAATNSTTLTSANITSTVVGFTDVTLNMNGTLSTSSVMTLPPFSSVLSAIVNPVAGQSWNLRIINSSAGNFPWTLATNTGWSLSSGVQINQNTWRDFYATILSLSSGSIQNRGTGTYS